MSKFKVWVGSKNPVKVKAAEAAFKAMFNEYEIIAEGVAVASGVPDQPMNYQETRDGAKNRVEALLSRFSASPTTDSDTEVEKTYFIAFEGGVDLFEGQPNTFAIICISDGNTMVFGQTASLPLPPCVFEKLLSGQELGHAMDSLFNTINIKQKGGAIGQLTQGLETRQSTYTSACVLALAPFVHKRLFIDNDTKNNQ
ncbi:inosine/xanthosine triphosphatase [Agaribacter flavus]|uniref:Inosine/xanthosine triphosphatase n=1 Tax=Agaribacter flavus TaxID=1902781 RepID=A0ABV7FQQ9_9ALTE